MWTPSSAGGRLYPIREVNDSQVRNTRELAAGVVVAAMVVVVVLTGRGVEVI